MGHERLPGALAALEAAAPDVPTVILGHSFGGQALGLSDATKRADAVVFLGAQSGYWKNWSGAALAARHALARHRAARHRDARLRASEDRRRPRLRPRRDERLGALVPHARLLHRARRRRSALASFAMPRLVLGFDDDN
ncbi:MAG: hypothetical protein R3B99_14900 [Polyangiales bacterium]